MPKFGQHDIPGVVYGLIDPITKEVRYVGQTTRTLEERLKDHLKECCLKIPCPKNTWLRSILTKGLKPEIVILEKGIAFDLPKIEMRWIEHYRLQDCGLTNRYPNKDIRGKWFRTFQEIEIKPKTKVS